MRKYEPRNYEGSLKQFVAEVNGQFDDGYELDKEYIEKLLQDQIIIRGTSLFDNKAWTKIKQRIINLSSQKRKQHTVKGIDTHSELKKYSAIEMDHVKD